MKIVYLQGWNSKFNEEKHKILSKFGDSVIYSKIDYKTNRNIIMHITDVLRSERDCIVIGTSFGGYIAYYASTYANVPALLINPAFYFKNGGELRPEGWRFSNENKNFVISMKDEVLDVRKTLKFLRDTNVDSSNVKLYDDLTHRMPLEVFDKEFSEFRNKSFKLIKERERARKEEELKEKEIRDDFAKSFISDNIPDRLDLPTFPKVKKVRAKLANSETTIGYIAIPTSQH